MELQQITMKTFSFWITTVIAFITLGTLAGCSVHHNDTKWVTRTAAYPKILERAKKDKRYIMMYSGVDTYTVTSVLIGKAKQQFTVTLNRLDSLHQANRTNLKALGEKPVSLYMRDSTSYTLDEPHTIPFSKVARIEVAE